MTVISCRPYYFILALTLTFVTACGDFPTQGVASLSDAGIDWNVQPPAPEDMGGAPEPPAPPTTWEVFSSLSPRCASCHGDGATSPLFASFQNFQDLIANNGEWVTPDAPDRSPLISLLKGEGTSGMTQMPPDGQPYAERVEATEQGLSIDSLIQWISQLEVVPPAPSIDCNVIQPGSNPLRRMTRHEYANVIEDIFDTPTDPTTGFPPEIEAFGFDNNAEFATVNLLLAEQYFSAADLVAQEATQSRNELLRRFSPECTDFNTECFHAVLVRVATLAYRRPLAMHEVNRITRLYDDTFEATQHLRESLETVISAILQSPKFLYRLETAPVENADSMTRVTGYEMASRLSFFLWSSSPDLELLNAAERGDLDTPEGIADAADAMLDDPRARRMLRRFYTQWLGIQDLEELNKSPSVYPDWNENLARMMTEETLKLLEHLTLEEDASLTELFSTTVSFVEHDLGELYGVDVPDDGQLHQVQLPDGERNGVLLRGAFLSKHAKHNQSSPIQRGVYFREQVLCQPLAPPPEDVDDEPPVPDDSATTQERFAAHTENETCAGCHSLIDPIGFGFEKFDGVGRFRTEENGLDINSEIILTRTEHLNGRFADASELTKSIGDDAEVQRCMVTQWMRFTSGRSQEPGDRCSLDSTIEGLENSGLPLRQLIVSMTQTDAFLYRPTTN